MKTTHIILTAVIVASVSAMAAGQGQYGNQQPQIDQTFERHNRDGSAVEATVTYAQRVGNGYVAYLYLTWGNVNGAVGPNARVHNWDGSVEVDDGTASIISTEGFETARSGGMSPQDQRAYQMEVRRYNQQRATFVANSEQQWQRQRAQAIRRIQNRRRLHAALNQIDDQHEARVAQFDHQMERDLAALHRQLSNNNRQRADRVTKNHDDEVEWQSQTGRDTDGVVIRLDLDDDDSEVEIEIGGHEIEFEVNPEPRHNQRGQQGRQGGHQGQQGGQQCQHCGQGGHQGQQCSQQSGHQGRQGGYQTGRGQGNYNVRAEIDHLRDRIISNVVRPNVTTRTYPVVTRTRTRVSSSPRVAVGHSSGSSISLHPGSIVIRIGR